MSSSTVKYKCNKTYHGIENAELLFAEFMNIHRGHGIRCEIRHDLGVGPRSIQCFTSG